MGPAVTAPRPRVVTFHMATVDGRITVAPGVNLMAGDERWSAIAGDLDPYTWIRAVHDPDVLLEGSGSFGVDPDGPRPAATQGSRMVSQDHHLPDQIVRVAGRRWFAVVDGRGQVDLRFTEWPETGWEGWHALVLACAGTPRAHLQRLRGRGIPYIVTGADRVDLAEALRVMGQRLGVRTVVATGGGRLSGALLRAGVLDEVDVEILPALVGGRGTPAMFDAPPLAPGEWPTSLELVDVQRLDGRLLVRWRVRGNAR